MDEKINYIKYKEILTAYLQEQNEQALYKAQQFSRKSLEHNISPEEIISLHNSVLQEVCPNITTEVRHSMDLLLEIMIGYGFAYREHQSLKTYKKELQTEIDIAASMQETLLKTDIPKIDCLDIGAISVPSKQMNGDYYHFVHDENNCVGVAIADVIGKGIPAALCMSMIKYSMDSLPENRMTAGQVLQNLNRVVEKNVEANMFITMFYGIYNPETHHFHYASAGHEPGFYYSAANEEFTEITTEGLVLGVSRSTTYKEYDCAVGKGDMIILLSDGVTECRSHGEFVERQMIIELIQRNIHLSSQQIVDKVYTELMKLQDFQLRDDFTLIILKRNV